MRLTMNLPSVGLSQGQLCVFHSLAEDQSTITVNFAPPGQRDLPPKNEKSFPRERLAFNHVEKNMWLQPMLPKPHLETNTISPEKFCCDDSSQGYG